MNDAAKSEQVLIEILTKLLLKHERLLAPGSDKQADIGTHESVFKPYANSQPLGIVEYINTLIQKYEKEGILTATWHTQNISLKRIYLQDYERLCELIQYTPLLKKLAVALQYLDNEMFDIPLYHALRDDIKAHWLEHKLFHKCSVNQYETLAKGFQGAHLALELYKVKEALDYRHFSIKAFQDSKKLSSHKGLIANLLKSQLPELEGFDVDEVFRFFGITPIAQPILISGSLSFTQHGSVLNANFPPAVGLFPTEKLTVSTQASIKVVTTIENQASFMRYIQEEKQPNEVVLYTAGIPTPTFITLFQKISKELDAQTMFRHWGDIDLGGFKIWNILNKSIKRGVKPYRMSPDDYLSSEQLKDLTKSEKIQLELLSNSDIEKLIQRVTSVGKKYEQEMWEKQTIKVGKANNT
ncbi:Wadjet anti-phage system protein JetD domain-containing protein [Thiomicrorhabdus sp. Kp2]|uniref:Wadjet anti-phage system protein JetD domain-containing protein n=1 Tax=Thiomicrorhabdus sp. Kp2 TaxID=1123518 RepID=UPI000410E6D5|nr:Wadjet anti-phage system protein JetD domain-containing protein [Thiomicrorhabdus sp. Kp2]